MAPSNKLPDSKLPATDAREDFSADPPELGTSQPWLHAPAAPPAHAPPAAPTAPLAAPAAQDGPKAPEPVQAAPAASYSPPGPAATVVLPEAVAPEPPFVAYPESDHDHPSRLPPAARPIRQG